MYDDPWRIPSPREPGLWGPPSLLDGDDRISHLVFLDGRLVDVWTESPFDTAYADLARKLDAERQPQVVRSPPPPPRHEQALDWLDGLVGGRDALLSLAPAGPPPPLRDVLDPVADEPWLVVDELVGDVCEALLSPDLEPPLRRCLLLLRERAPWLPERTAPDRIAAGIVWVVGKANAAIGPAGPVPQTAVASHLGVSSLTAHGNAVVAHVRRLGWTAHPPFASSFPTLFATGRAELLADTVVADLLRLRDDALAEQRRGLPSQAES